RNVIGSNPAVAAELHDRLLNFIAECGASAERVALYTEPQPRLALRQDAPLYAIQDERGLWLAYPTETEADSYLTPRLRTAAIEPISFGDLLQRQSRALVSVHGQYYR